MRTIKNSSPQSTTISRLSHDGRGVTSLDGKVAFVVGALPGEEVTWEPVRKNKSYLDAKVISVEKNSEDRISPKCSKFLTCGGCSLQHLSTDKQLEFKQNIVKEQLSHFGNLNITQDRADNIWLPPITADNFGYRHKARLGVRYVPKKERVLIGFSEKFSTYVTDLDYCEVLHPIIADLLKPLESLVYSLSIREHIPQIEAALGDNNLALIIRHLQPLTQEDEVKLKDFAKNNNIILFLQSKGPKTIFEFYPGNTEWLTYSLPEFNITYKFHPTDFTQVNPSINKKMVKYAIELLDLKNTDTVLDLFCGLGNFTLPIAKFAKKAVGVELNSEMVKRGYLNAKFNNLPNVEFYQQDLISLEISSDSILWQKQCYNKVLLDPARSGAKEILPKVIELSPEKIVYVSCNPATFARDAGILCESGYILSKIRLLDMFPQTAHVETIALFEK